MPFLVFAFARPAEILCPIIYSFGRFPGYTQIHILIFKSSIHIHPRLILYEENSDLFSS